ncbi:MAG TPA: DNA internalization-related competence protein ComEC/Rec2 [Polyangiaceae bacterium]|nr:DNA internalization-related competence protein ComEC/Rec2 [Polyangiaceae bacterium]
MRLDPVLVVAAAVVGGQTAAVAPVPAACGALGVAVALAPGLTRKVLALALVAFVLSAGRAALTLRGFEDERVRVRDAIGAPARCSGAGAVVSSPVRTGASLAFVAELGTLDCEGREVGGPLLARLHGAPADLARGDRFELVGQLAPVQLFRNAPAHDALPGAARRGITLSGAALDVLVTRRARGLPAVIDRVRAHARARITATFSAGAESMARALVLGENDLDPEDDAAFRKSGLSHMLAVSGTHLVFAVVGVVAAFGALLVRCEPLAVRFEARRVASLLGVPLALVYADFAGGSGSAWRAAWMLAFGFAARVCGRAPDATRSLAASLLVGAAYDALAAFDVSFLLSAAATVGLLTVGPSLTEPLRRLPKVARLLGHSVAATVAAMAPCAPLLALLAPDLTVAGVLANVLAAPFGETIALPLCLSHVLLAPWPLLERGVALVASGALLVVKQVARESASATFLAVRVPDPTPWHFALLAFGAVVVVAPWQYAGVGARRLPRPLERSWRGLCTVAVALALTLLELGAKAAGQSRGKLRVTALDVGQGDANLVELPDGAAWLVDGGGMVGNPIDTGAAVVLPVLRSKRRARLDVVVLTHPHPDHFGGLAAVLRGVEVGELWDSGQGEAEGAGPEYASLLALARRRHIPVRRPAELCGHPRRDGGATIEVLAPCPGFVPGRGANDNSLVLRVTFGERAVLLTGDAEALEEADLVGRYGRTLAADYLKAGHHGSRTSTGEALLTAVEPTWATLSSGVRNRFGHPHAPTVERLLEHGVRTFRLDRSGSFEWTTDGHGVSVRLGMLPR